MSKRLNWTNRDLNYYYHAIIQALTYWNIINPHATQCSSVIAEVILYGRICHLKKTFIKEKVIYPIVAYMTVCVYIHMAERGDGDREGGSRKEGEKPGNT